MVNTAVDVTPPMLLPRCYSPTIERVDSASATFLFPFLRGPGSNPAMVAYQRWPFPSHLWSGIASAAYQVEGAVKDEGRGPSIWDVLLHRVVGYSTAKQDGRNCGQRVLSVQASYHFVKLSTQFGSSEPFEELETVLGDIRSDLYRTAYYRDYMQAILMAIADGVG